MCLFIYFFLKKIDEIKAAVVTKIGIKKLIDLMDIGARQPQGEAVVYSAAQVLANIASKGF